MFRLVIRFLLVCMISLTMVLVGGAPGHAQQSEFRVMIEADDVVLGASLTIPERCPQKGCPAVVLGHGSAPSTREDLGFYRNIARKLNFAVLAYDKRGVGESSGVYHSFSIGESEQIFHSLAKDMVAVTHWLSEQKNIDASRIGFLGGSQAGWIMPLAVHMGAPAAFIIIGEGTPLSAGQEARHGQVFIDRFGAEDAPEITFRDVHAADLAVSAYDGPSGFDPSSVLADLNTPMLWLFGLNDTVIPVLPSLRRLEGAIADGKNNHSVHVFPYGDHNFRNLSNGSRYDLVEIIGPWLADLHTE